METSLLVLGKSDNTITMILDNLYSNGLIRDITIYNNLKLPVLYPFNHPHFNITILEELKVEKYNRYILGITKPLLKKKIVENLKPDIDKFITITHQSLDISATSTIGKGCLVNSKVSIAAQTIIHDFVSINRNVSIGHHTIIEKFCAINPGCNIAGHVHIKEGTTIGIGAAIIDGITIGKNTIIGAGSVVTKNIPDNVIAYGSPCKVIRANI